MIVAILYEHVGSYEDTITSLMGIFDRLPLAIDRVMTKLRLKIEGENGPEPGTKIIRRINFSDDNSVVFYEVDTNEILDDLFI